MNNIDDDAWNIITIQDCIHMLQLRSKNNKLDYQDDLSTYNKMCRRYFREFIHKHNSRIINKDKIKELDNEDYENIYIDLLDRNEELVTENFDTMNLPIVKQVAHSAFNELHNKYKDLVFKYCIRKCRENSDAEDIVQETWSYFWKSILDYKYDAYPLNKHLLTIAYSRVVDFYRKKHPKLTRYTKHISINDDSGMLTLEDKNEDVEQYAIAYNLIESTFNRISEILSETEKKILGKRLEGKDNQMIALEIGIRRDGVKKHWSKIISKWISEKSRLEKEGYDITVISQYLLKSNTIHQKIKNKFFQRLDPIEINICKKLLASNNRKEALSMLKKDININLNDNELDESISRIYKKWETEIVIIESEGFDVTIFNNRLQQQDEHGEKNV